MGEVQIMMSCTRGVWHGTPQQCDRRSSTTDAKAKADLLLCPHCQQPVRPFDMTNFLKEIEKIEQGDYTWPAWKGKPAPNEWKPTPHPGTLLMWQWAWQSGRCFHHFAHLKNAYRKATGIDVNIEP